MFPLACPLVIDGRFRLHAIVWAVASFLVFGLVSAMIPNPVFGRQIPPEAFAVAVWILSSPLMGVVGATYTAPLPAAVTQPVAFRSMEPLAVVQPVGPAEERRSSTLGTLGSLGAFLAIGCPICNKLALVLLGTSGALSIWAPIQPVLGGLSLVLLAVTAAWRVRLRMRGGACPT